MSNRHIEDVTIKLILERERLAGRWAVGTRNRATLADILGDSPHRGEGLRRDRRRVRPLAESRQVQAGLDDPSRFHLVTPDRVRSAVPRIIDIHGEPLTALLDRRREKRYVEVPCSTAMHDSLVDGAAGGTR